MENCNITVDKNGKITIVIDGNARGGRSASGKTVTVASTRGNVPVALPDGTQVTIGLNAYVK